jgi:bifunctional ADP-heptose synthase (sugar kinase/adenylyltransferase)
MMTQVTPTESESQEKDRILIIGDLLIDETWEVEASKISPEAPVIVVNKLHSQPIRKLGGAGLAASFLSHEIEDAGIDFYTAAPNDLKMYINSTTSMNIENIEIDHSDLVIKKRFIDARSHYHILRVDNDKTVIPQSLDIKRLKDILLKRKPKVVMILDYCKGFLSNPRKTTGLINLLKEINVPVYVDSRRVDLSSFKNTDILKLNLKEFEAQKRKNETPEELMKRLRVKNLIITKGEEGAEYFSLKRRVGAAPSIGNYTGIPDVTGCGDVFDSMFCYWYYIKEEPAETALKKAVERATAFAYQPIKERLCQI